MKDKKVLVVSAHAADFVWRGGGTIAKYVKYGAEVHVVVLSFGVRGESNDLWKEPGQTVENVKKIRQQESEAAAAALGVKNIEFWDFEDYPIEIDRERLDKLVVKIRQVQPNIIISHDKTDVLNQDHNIACDYVWKANNLSTKAGIITEGYKTATQMAIYGFAPHQTELSNYTPGTFIDITDTFEMKVAAMKCFQAQSHLIDHYTKLASMRGTHARRLSGIKDIKYAETFSNMFPVVGSEFACR